MLRLRSGSKYGVSNDRVPIDTGRLVLAGWAVSWKYKSRQHTVAATKESAKRVITTSS